ncbi:hypothetical protein [Larkinella humicola]|uniref:Uncharacterized protein n=1 Tax=Larkinella humicola TaxID=2607654 RepID=A0A5N1JP87_9BACT|nr:hypothetical protein [Larkinella humicola]KAA9357277.1 hypothetical protein F0P93_05945 [Larkinella humicola]
MLIAIDEGKADRLLALLERFGDNIDHLSALNDRLKRLEELEKHRPLNRDEILKYFNRKEEQVLTYRRRGCPIKRITKTEWFAWKHELDAWLDGKHVNRHTTG